MMTSSSDTRLVEVVPGKAFSEATLKKLLPDIETALFFAKVYKLDHVKLGELLSTVFNTTLIKALTKGQHSTELQDYLVDTVPASLLPKGKSISFKNQVPPGQFLPELWEQLEVQIIASIAELSEKLIDTLEALPTKNGNMVFQTMAKLQKQRPVIGVFEAQVKHQRVPDVLVILDVSGSMSASTIAEIVDDVVALSWKASAHLAIVSDTATFWEPGTYEVSDILGAAEYSGTRYEQLAPLFDKDWGTVITIADYDSSASAKAEISKRKGRIGQVLDISLVNQPTYLGECAAQLADSFRPLLVANTSHVLS